MFRPRARVIFNGTRGSVPWYNGLDMKVPNLHLQKAAEDVLYEVARIDPDGSPEDLQSALWRAYYLYSFLARTSKQLERAGKGKHRPVCPYIPRDRREVSI